MAGILERLRYMIEDAFGKKTYAESQRDKYKKIVNGLQEQMDKTGSLGEVQEQLKQEYNIMEVNPDSARGKLSDTFQDRERENRRAVEALGAALRSAIAEVRNKQAFAQGEYEYWCGEAEREDREMKVYQQQYYAEEERLRREEAQRREAERRAAEQRAAQQRAAGRSRTK